MRVSSTPRRKADELLLAAPGDGWVDRETVIREMMRFVMPGQAHRTAARSRRGTDADEPRRRDTLLVGSRQKANQYLANALKYGVWEYDRESKRLRHRDNPGAAVVVDHPVVVVDDPELPPPDPESSGGFVVPPLEQVTTAVAVRSALEQFTKWHWAAIILTHVEVDEHGGSKTKSSLALSTAEFADLGVTGLRSKDTVRKYHAYALQHWGRRPEPGDTITIPTMDTWPKDTGPTPGNMPPAPSKKKERAPRAPSVRVDDHPAHIAAKFIAWHGEDALVVVQQVLEEAAKRSPGRQRNRLKVVTS